MHLPTWAVRGRRLPKRITYQGISLKAFLNMGGNLRSIYWIWSEAIHFSRPSRPRDLLYLSFLSNHFLWLIFLQSKCLAWNITCICWIWEAKYSLKKTKVYFYEISWTKNLHCFDMYWYRSVLVLNFSSRFILSKE